MHQIVYISSPESQEIYVWKLDNINKKLVLIQILRTPGHAQPIVIHPNQKFLYVGIRPHFRIVSYYINSDGLLNEIKSIKIPSSPTYLLVNDSGKFLYCASYNFNMINVIKINELGIPHRVVQIINNLMGCHSVNIDKDKELLWAPCLLEDSIRLFSIHSVTGILKSYNPDRIIFSIKSGPRHMVFHRFNNYAYVLNELNGNINVIKYNLKNMFSTIVQTVNILPDYHNVEQFWSSDIHITPDNCWLYCVDRFSHIISCFKICSKTKQLKFVYSQYTEKQPRNFAIDVTGRFLVVAGQKSHYISLYSINLDNGQLNIISRYPSGSGPLWVSIYSI